MTILLFADDWGYELAPTPEDQSHAILEEAAAAPPPQLRPKPGTQLWRVWTILAEPRWQTLHEIAAKCRSIYSKTDSEAAISARIRELRNEYGCDIPKPRIRKGTKATREYRILLPSIEQEG